MNATRTRSMMAEGMIIVAVLAAAHMLLVQPAERRAAQAAATLASMRATIAEASESAASAAAPGSERADRLQEMSERSRDAARVYQTISELGERAGVRIDRVQPTPFVADARTARGLAGVGCSISASGSYESIARFLDALQRDAGFAAPTAVRLAPLVVDGAEMVQASIDTAHRAIDLEAIVAGASAGPSTEDDE